jgi:hypothetical protein
MAPQRPAAGSFASSDVSASKAKSHPIPEKLLFKTKMCRFAAVGKCRHGVSCPFAHSESELSDQPDFSKTAICRDWLNGRCSMSNCVFAHGEAELRKIPSSKNTPPQRPSQSTPLQYFEGSQAKTVTKGNGVFAQMDADSKWPKNVKNRQRMPLPPPVQNEGVLAQRESSGLCANQDAHMAGQAQPLYAIAAQPELCMPGSNMFAFGNRGGNGMPFNADNAYPFGIMPPASPMSMKTLPHRQTMQHALEMLSPAAMPPLSPMNMKTVPHGQAMPHGLDPIEMLSPEGLAELDDLLRNAMPDVYED